MCVVQSVHIYIIFMDCAVDINCFMFGQVIVYFCKCKRKRSFGSASSIWLDSQYLICLLFAIQVPWKSSLSSYSPAKTDGSNRVSEKLLFPFRIRFYR